MKAKNFEELVFTINDKCQTSCLCEFENGITAEVIIEKPNTVWPYRIVLKRNGEAPKEGDYLFEIGKNINFLHGPIGVTCVLVGLSNEK